MRKHVIRPIMMLATISLFLQRSTAATDIYADGFSLIYSYDLQEANQLSDSLIDINPDHPKPYLLKTAVYWWYFISDLDNQQFKDDFLREIKEAIQVAERYRKENQDDPEGLLYLGGFYGYLGRYYTLTNKWFGAYKSGKKARKFLESLMKKRPDMHDAYLGLGLYHYYADQLPKIIKILSFLLGIRGDKELGLQELRIAAEKGVYAKTEAIVSLGWINVQFERNYQEAVEIFSGLVQKFPLNPIFNSFLGLAHRRGEEYDSAKAVYQSVLNNPEVKYASNNQRAELNASLAFTYELGRDYETARRYYAVTESLGSEDYFKNAPWLYFNIARCEEEMENTDKAITYYEKVLKCHDYFGHHSRAKEKIKKLRSPHSK
ncbi:MAG: tetratricopeptide repeat protein [Bacteroidota bacterium]